MAIGNRFVLPLQQIVDNQGVPYNGASATFYATGTSTLQAIYYDALLTVPSPNPTVTYPSGFWPPIFMVASPAYRVVIADPTGAVLFDQDPVCGIPTSGFGGYIPGYVPPGAIIPFAGATPPTGWLFADGSAVSRTVYAPLFAMIGTRYGAGDGATTFNVPDLRGRVAAGADGQGGVAAGRLTAGNSGVAGDTLGASGGNELLMAHSHLIADPGHNHVVNDPSHDHLQFLGQGTGDVNGWNISFHGVRSSMDVRTSPEDTGITINSATTGINNTASAGAGASQNVQPTLVTLYIVYSG